MLAVAKALFISYHVGFDASVMTSGSAPFVMLRSDLLIPAETGYN